MIYILAICIIIIFFIIISQIVLFNHCINKANDKDISRYFNIIMNTHETSINMERVRFIRKIDGKVEIFFDVNPAIIYDGKDVNDLYDKILNFNK